MAFAPPSLPNALPHFPRGLLCEQLGSAMGQQSSVGAHLIQGTPHVRVPGVRGDVAPGSSCWQKCGQVAHVRLAGPSPRSPHKAPASQTVPPWLLHETPQPWSPVSRPSHRRLLWRLLDVAEPQSPPQGTPGDHSKDSGQRGGICPPRAYGTT